MRSYCSAVLANSNKHRRRRSLPKDSSLNGGPREPLDVPSLASLLRGCRDVPAVRALHRRITKSGRPGHKLLGNALIYAYGKFALVADARTVFDHIRRRDACSWNAMISAYSHAGHSQQVMELFGQMLADEDDGPRPDRFTFAGVLSACRDVAERRSVHARIVASGVETDSFLEAALVGAYSSSECLPCAAALFGRIPARRRNAAAWNFVIDAHICCGDCEEAMRLFRRMRSEEEEGVRANDHTFAMMLGACSELGESKLIHSMVVDVGGEADVVLETALVSAYGRHGMADAALALHRRLRRAARQNTVSWNAVITAHSRGGRLADALELFEEMGMERVRPNCVTFASILSACADAVATPEGTRFHACLIASGAEVDAPLGNTLIHMYGECRILHRANALFHRMPWRNAASWSSIISAHASAGHNVRAIQLFWSMQRHQPHEFTKPSSFTYMAVLNASANLSQLTDAKPIHSCITASGIDIDCALDNALLNMYSKCGSLADARRIFDRMHVAAALSVFSWTAMVTAYAQTGHAMETLKLYRVMSALPNGVTFVAILSACSHSGLVDDGRFYFDAIARDHGMAPTVEHYSCMIDLLSRAGLLGEAEDFMKNMPLEAGVLDWLALLGACRTRMDLDRGVRAARHAIELDPKNSAPYIVLSNMYAAAGI